MNIILPIQRILNVVDYSLKPITYNVAFFLNMVLLMIVPSLLNAYIVNPEVYIHYTSDRFIGFFVKNGVSFPFILFFPVVISYLVCLIFLISKNKMFRLIFHCIIYIGMMVLYVTNIFLLFNFRTMISPNIILLLEETSSGESSDFIVNYAFTQNSLWVYIICIFTLIVLFCIVKNGKFLKSFLKKRDVSVLLFLFLFYVGIRIGNSANVFLGLFRCEKVSDVESWYLDFPPDCNTLTNVVYSFYTNHISHRENEESKRSSMADLGNVSSESDAIIILVIGESYSKHHSNLYGYEKNTNPFLFQEMRNGNLYVFQDVISSYNTTSYVMKNLFSTNSLMDNERWSSCPIFPAIIKKAGFNVYFWDNQKTTNADISDFSIFSYIYDSSISKLAYTQCNTDIYPFDMDLIKSFFTVTKIREKKDFIIFHFIGQHAMAQTKYPHIPKYTYFTPDSVSGNYTEMQKEQIAYYDNATRYNDDVMRYLISLVRNKECVIVYLSDHGEEVHDYRNHYGRTQESIKTANILKYQYEIPFMIWCSDKYKEKYPNKIENIKAALDKPFMNDNTCQILFDIADINCDYYKSERDLISPSFQPYPYRRVQNTVIYENVIKGNN